MCVIDTIPNHHTRNESYNLALIHGLAMVLLQWNCVFEIGLHQ